MPGVAHARIRGDCYDDAFEEWLGEPQRRIQGGSARRPDKDPFRPCDPTRRGLSVLRGDGHQFVREVRIPDPRDDGCLEMLDALNAVKVTHRQVAIQPHVLLLNYLTTYQ